MQNQDAVKPIRVGLIGAGWVTHHHLIAWRKQQHVQVVAICDPDLSAARKRADEFGIEAVFESAIEMLECSQLDAVDIASPRHTHADMVRMAAKNGLHILCQKPLAPTLPEAQQLVVDVEQAANDGNAVRMMVHENWRFRPYYRQAKQWIADGLIGAPRLCLMSLFSSGMLADADGTRPMLVRQPFLAGLERMLVTEVLIHHIDTLRYLLGELLVKDAVTGCVTPVLLGEDIASVTLSGAGNMRVSLQGDVAAAGYPTNIVDQLAIHGGRGSIILNGGQLQLAGEYNVLRNYELPVSYQASYDATIAHFVQCLRENLPFETSPQDNLKTMQIVEDIYRLAAMA